MFFEARHSVGQSDFRCSWGKGLDFPIHIHKSFEFFAQIRGETLVTIDGKEYALGEGEAVLIFPFQTHSYKTIAEGKHMMCIFSGDLVMEYSKQKANLLPESNLFFYHAPDAISENPYLQISLLYHLCGAFDVGMRYKKQEKNIYDPCIIKLLMYAEENYQTPCLLEDAAAAIGYDYAYLSKKFKKSIGISFRKYINMLRITLAKQLLTKESQSMSEIFSACGFNSARAFNMEFKKAEGMTPTEYKRKSAKG